MPPLRLLLLLPVFSSARGFRTSRAVEAPLPLQRPKASHKLPEGSPGILEGFLRASPNHPESFRRACRALPVMIYISASVSRISISDAALKRCAASNELALILKHPQKLSSDVRILRFVLPRNSKSLSLFLLSLWRTQLPIPNATRHCATGARATIVTHEAGIASLNWKVSNSRTCCRCIPSRSCDLPLELLVKHLAKPPLPI